RFASRRSYARRSVRDESNRSSNSGRLGTVAPYLRQRPRHCPSAHSASYPPAGYKQSISIFSPQLQVTTRRTALSPCLIASTWGATGFATDSARLLQPPAAPARRVFTSSPTLGALRALMGSR